MKNISILLFITVLFVSLVAFQYGKQTSGNSAFQDEETHQVDVPENVQVVLDRSCLPCHGADGSGKAKMKWNYEKMPEYSRTKLISKLIKVSEKVENGKMPPLKKLKKHPDWKLSDKEKKVLMEWAEGAAEQLTGGD